MSSRNSPSIAILPEKLESQLMLTHDSLIPIDQIDCERDARVQSCAELSNISPSPRTTMRWPSKGQAADYCLPSGPKLSISRKRAQSLILTAPSRDAASALRRLELRESIAKTDLRVPMTARTSEYAARLARRTIRPQDSMAVTTLLCTEISSSNMDTVHSESLMTHSILPLHGSGRRPQDVYMRRASFPSAADRTTDAIATGDVTVNRMFESLQAGHGMKTPSGESAHSLANRTCPFRGCGKVLCRASYMRDHLMLHTRARPYTCPVPSCLRKFRWASNLARHRKTSHRAIADAPRLNVS